MEQPIPRACEMICCANTKATPFTRHPSDSLVQQSWKEAHFSQLHHAATHYVRKNFESSQMEEAAFVLTPFIKSTLSSTLPSTHPGGVEEAGQLQTGSAGGGRQAGLLAMGMRMDMQM